MEEAKPTPPGVASGFGLNLARSKVMERVPHPFFNSLSGHSKPVG
jgi:hypothetical protein